ncbi:hypothetical protein IAI10_04320 [Clostridium sp. 19966]|uniref:hypothetical protein n=1 Tax=Clostridium sp. 19966 TaxID=2768166 RepID=UPI0028DF46F1|nr:hypothetical protein [Clostridium sp. 19966]MDT8715872.1 hypothetical protein [Clostridium sp. 19966]
MNNKIKITLGSIACSLVIGVCVQANSYWGGAATPGTGSMTAYSYSQNKNDTSIYEISTDLTFYDSNYNLMDHEPSRYSNVDGYGNAYISIPQTKVVGNVAHVQSYHTFVDHNNDVSEVYYTEY